MAADARRRLSGGVEPQGAGLVHARVWAPSCRTIDLVLDRDRSRAFPLEQLEGISSGIFEGLVEGVHPGDRYWLRLDGDRLRPDPVSRAQPEGPHGPSQVVDPASYKWHDEGWTGVAADGQ